MADHDVDPEEQVPEADLLEQRTPLTAEPLNDEDTEAAPVPPESLRDAADEADQVEQHTVVPGDDDDYPSEPPPGWS